MKHYYKWKGVNRKIKWYPYLLLIVLGNFHLGIQGVRAQDVTTAIPRTEELNIENDYDAVTPTDNIAVDKHDWWYENVQKDRNEKMVHEFKISQQSSNVTPNVGSMFDVLQPNISSTSRTSMVVQFYTSNEKVCVVCRELVDHYLGLAIHLSNIVSNTMAKTYNKNGLAILPTFYAINCVEHELLCQQQQVTYYPAIRLYKNEGSKTIRNKDVFEISYQHMHPYDIMQTLGINEDDLSVDDEAFLVSADFERAGKSVDETVTSAENESSSFQQSNGSTNTLYYHRSRKDLLNDIHIALDYTFRKVVFTHKKSTHLVHVPHGKHQSELTAIEQEVLKSFLMLIQKTILQGNAETSHANNMVKAVVDGFVYATKNQMYMDAIIKDHRPLSTHFSSHACPHDSRTNNNNVDRATTTLQSKEENTDNRLYSCVMWDLLLMISVGMVDYNLQSYDATEMLHPASVMKTIYEYVDIFGLSSTGSVYSSDNANSTDLTLAVDDLAKAQFLTLYNDCAFMNRCKNLPEAPTWIYEDNKQQVSKEYIIKITTTSTDWKFVSKYLAAVRNAVMESSDDASRWPPHDICSVCWNDSTKETKSFVHNELNLYKYLKVEYGRIDMVAATYRQELVQESLMLKQKQTQPVMVSHLDKRTEDFLVVDDSQQISGVVADEAFLVSRHNTPTRRNHVPLYLFFVLCVILLWLYIHFKQDKKNPYTDSFSYTTIYKGTSAQSSKLNVVSNIQNSELDGSISSHRTIERNCERDDTSLQTQQVIKHVSPRVHRMMKRRLAVEKEQEEQERLQNITLTSSQLEKLEETLVFDDFVEDSGIDSGLSYMKNGRSSSLSSTSSNPNVVLNVSIAPSSMYSKCENSTAVYDSPICRSNQLRHRKTPEIESPLKSKVAAFMQ